MNLSVGGVLPKIGPGEFLSVGGGLSARYDFLQYIK